MMVQLEDIIIERHEQKRKMTSGYSILREEDGAGTRPLAIRELLQI